MFKKNCNIQELKKLYRSKFQPEKATIFGDGADQENPDEKVEHWLKSCHGEDCCKEEKVYLKVNVPIFLSPDKSENVSKYKS